MRVTFLSFTRRFNVLRTVSYPTISKKSFAIKLDSIQQNFLSCLLFPVYRSIIYRTLLRTEYDAILGARVILSRGNRPLTISYVTSLSILSHFLFQ